MINWKAWAIHVLGGVTAHEQEAGLRLARPLKRQLADINESCFKLGHYHKADREAADAWVDFARDAPTAPPASEWERAAQSNAAFPARQAAFAAHIRTRYQMPAVPHRRPMPAQTWVAEQARLDKAHDERR